MRPRRLRGTALCSLLLVAAAGAMSSEREEPRPLRLMPLIGQPRSAPVEPGDTLLDIAWRERVSYETLVRLNAGVDPWIPEPGARVRLPTWIVLPDARREGLVINIPEMRLFDFGGDGRGPTIFPVAVGDAEDPTPTGRFLIGAKRRDPAWYVPESIREEKPELPAVVPPGPGNPLGTRWMTIGNTSYGIHGTSVRWSIGHMATHGCVRLYEPDVQQLYERVPRGTPLEIVYQPFKWGLDGRHLYLEVHADLYGRHPDPVAAALALPRALGLLAWVDVPAIGRAIEERRGVPVHVGRLPHPGAARAPTWRSPS